MGYGWGSGKSGIWIKSFLYIKFFKKKFTPANSHEDPNLTMHWHRQMGMWLDSLFVMKNKDNLERVVPVQRVEVFSSYVGVGDQG